MGWVNVDNIRPGGSLFFRLNWSEKNSGYGIYTIAWHSGEMTETKKFEILPASSRQPN